MNPNMTFAFIGGPLVAMQIMKLYQKEKKGNYLHIPILSEREREREKGEYSLLHTSAKRKKK